MKRALFAVVSFLAASVFAGPVELGVQAYMAQNGLDPAGLNRRGGPAQVLIRDGEPELRWLRHKLRNVPAPSLDALPGPEEAQAILDAWAQESLAARQATKSPRLKGAEKQLIQFLRDEGVVAADAVTATPEQIDAMYEGWEAKLNDTQLEKKSIKYTRILEKVERAGGTEADAYYHE